MNHQENDFRNLFFTYSIDLLATVSPLGYFISVNPAFEKTLGYTREEMLASPIVSFLHPDDVEKTKKRIKVLSTGSSTISSINRYRRKDGVYRYFSWNTTPIGNVFYTVGRDITDQVSDLQRSEEQVQQLQKMDAVGRLAGGIAHDFNNMLSAISLYCELLLDERKQGAIPANVENIRRVTDRAAALTRQLLIFGRKQLVQFQTIDIGPLVQQLEHMLIRLIGENIKIVTKLPAGLDAVNVDPSQMEQVLLNLVVNARDAMPNGGTIHIELSNVYLDENFSSTHLQVERGHYVLLSVSDNGMGMDAATLSRIFEPFFTTKSTGKGTGLGLTTTYGIVKQCGGTIWVYSEIDKGTVFKIYLPVADKVATEPLAPATPIAELAGTQTILLVEDDETLRTGFSATLERKGFHVLVAANGKEALEFVRNHQDPIHLMLTDVVMPGMSGFELVKAAQAIRGDLKFLYMSGYVNDALEHSGLGSLGPLEFIQKPFGTAALVAKVQAILSR